MAFGAVLPGAVHAGIKVASKTSLKNASKKRQQALMKRGYLWRQIEREKKLEALLEKYDTSKTGNLNREELASLLQDAPPTGNRPTDEEITFVLRSTIRTETDRNCVNKKEIPAALDIWKAYDTTKPEIDKHFEKYDTNQSGKLEKDQLKNLLTELNDGTPPEDREVEWVLKTVDGALEGVDSTGGVNKTELMGAISLRYTYVEEGESGCCIVM
eukprot:CAMPEP_0184305770 /NCGR_PEP_ID=MMETSP1049-20130417/14960_1 /TAXON_ID=77928 /ORGANISM="Proteomonas sulcata, Strain CCMP704" /LENGTH=213 /DNA_ID=CAMNT_0026617905 /DNA_START=31 /DNA_END=672 /DNA_ORIENTATION=+